jgi:nucleoside-diphosphate-sugar epimerase
MFHALYGTPVVILRVFMVYGPGQQDLKKLVPYVTLSLLRGETPQLSSGVRQVDWVYVDDVVEAFMAALSAKGIEGGTIDVGTGRLESVRTVVEQLFDIVCPGTQPAFGSTADRALEQSRVADVESSFLRIGWNPRTSLREGLARTVKWYRERMEQGVY